MNKINLKLINYMFLLIFTVNYELSEEEIDTMVAHKLTTLYTGNVS